MPGDRLFLDTNALLSVLAGNGDLVERLAQASWVGTSVVCVLEFQGFPNLGDEDQMLFDQLIQRLNVINLQYPNTELLKAISRMRAQRTVKLPDAIVAASAYVNQATLMTRDQALLKAGVALDWLAQDF